MGKCPDPLPEKASTRCYWDCKQNSYIVTNALEMPADKRETPPATRTPVGDKKPYFCTKTKNLHSEKHCRPKMDVETIFGKEELLLSEICATQHLDFPQIQWAFRQRYYSRRYCFGKKMQSSADDKPICACTPLRTAKKARVSTSTSPVFFYMSCARSAEKLLQSKTSTNATLWPLAWICTAT
jgi:hypothetical protein